MGRTWISVPFGRTGIRIGRSISDSEMRPRLPSWRRFELRRGLQEAAKARGETMTKDEADYCIDKALATGLLDGNGYLNFVAKGFTADELAAQIVEMTTTWGHAVSHEDAMRIAKQAIRKIDRRRLWKAMLWAAGTTVAVLAGLVALGWGVSQSP